MGMDVLQKVNITLKENNPPQVACASKRYVIQPGQTKLINCLNQLDYSGPVLLQNDLSLQDEIYDVKKKENFRVTVTNWGINPLEISRMDKIGMLAALSPQAIQDEVKFANLGKDPERSKD